MRSTKKQLRFIIFLLTIAALCVTFLFSIYLSSGTWLGVGISSIGALAILSAIALLVGIFRTADD